MSGACVNWPIRGCVRAPRRLAIPTSKAGGAVGDDALRIHRGRGGSLGRAGHEQYGLAAGQPSLALRGSAAFGSDGWIGVKAYT